MRISDSAKREMKSNIISDLYSKSEATLKDREEDIAKRNRIYELEPYQEVLDSLPVELVAHARMYQVQIKYKPEQNDPDIHAIDEKWGHYYEKDVMAFVSPNGNNYGTTTGITGKLDYRLYTDAAALAEELIELRAAKKELRDYLDSTLEKWSGPKQLRTVWPESLHKYIPVIKARTPKSKKDKPSSPTAAEAPASLGIRLTTNLLEGK